MFGPSTEDITEGLRNIRNDDDSNLYPEVITRERERLSFKREGEEVGVQFCCKYVKETRTLRRRV